MFKKGNLYSANRKGFYMSKETKEKLRNANLGKNHTPETKKKISNATKGDRNPFFGKHHSQETINKIIEGNRGKTLSEATKLKMSLAGKGRKFSKAHKLRISMSNKGKEYSEETKKKMRESRLHYIENCTGIPVNPRIGKNEKEVLDKLEQKLNYKIHRQFRMSGYFIDGCVPELNLAIEIDERPKILERDIEREDILKRELGCKFLRIKDYV